MTVPSGVATSQAEDAPAVEVLEELHASPDRRARGGFRVERADSVLELAGWALGLDSAVIEVEVSAGGEIVGRATPTAKRPDIAAAFPDRDAADRCGFALALEPSGAGQSVLTVDAALADGSRVALGELRVATR
jgi:hypothetical protein